MSHVVMMHSSPLTHAFVYSQWAISMIQNDAPTSPPRSLAAFVAAESVRRKSVIHDTRTSAHILMSRPPARGPPKRGLRLAPMKKSYTCDPVIRSRRKAPAWPSPGTRGRKPAAYTASATASPVQTIVVSSAP